MRTSASKETLEKALETINGKYKGNVRFNRWEVKGGRVHFTLRVNNSREPGHRLGFNLTSVGNQRRLTSACWHVHGDFFDAVWSIDPKAKIYAGRVGWMRGKEDNWQDKNIGSIWRPMYFSEACECG